jgi:hypothetical protein
MRSRNYLWPMIAGFLFRLAMMPFAHLSNPSLWEYGTIAKNLWLGRGYSNDWNIPGISHPVTLPSAFMPPGGVMIHYLGFLFFGDSIAAHAFIFFENVAFGVIFIYAIGALVYSIFHDRRLSMLAAWLAALDPIFVFSTSSFGVIAPLLAMNALFFLSLTTLSSRIEMGGDSRLTVPALVVGVLGGILTFFRSEAYVLVAATFILSLWRYRSNLRRVAAPILISMFAMLITVSPWIIRNEIVFHRMVPGSSNSGFNFWRGHSDLWGQLPLFGQNAAPWPETWPHINPGTLPNSNMEFERDSLLQHEANDWIIAHPAIEATRSLRKLALFWGIDFYNATSLSPIYIATYALTLIFLILGFWRMRKTRMASARAPIAVIMLWMVLYSVLVIVFFPMVRLQVIVSGVYFPIVVYGVGQAIELFDRKFEIKKLLG